MVQIISILVLLLCSTALATVQVMTPVALKEKISEIQHRFPLFETDKEKSEELGFVRAAMANFGHISYGETLIAEVFTPLSNKEGCRPFSANMFTKRG